ncbi:hypothetical protein [Xylanimonas oleitrophica]|nr:hypothetical protein [Xylanimonas oleitrophica]
MTAADYRYEQEPNVWFHPETGVSIWDEDMPWELRPEREEVVDR